MAAATRIVATIMGCGSSGGVPRIGGNWGACDPADPRNRRRRCSLLIEGRTGDNEPTRIVIDTGCDLREQLLSANVDRVDAVLYTHEHADHTHGIDDLRPVFINRRRRLDVWLDEYTARSMHDRFGYCFKTPPGSDYPPIASERRLTAGTAFSIDGQGGPVDVLPVLQDHGEIASLGFRFGNVAYSTDLKRLPETSIAALQRLDVWIVDALRRSPHPSHFNLAETLEWIDRIKPKRAILTDMHTDMDYATLRRESPPNVEPAFDGMAFDAN
jgi:phosphoribosyl 1,2-cyclic phosphate phosphodiesterase